MRWVKRCRAFLKDESSHGGRPTGVRSEKLTDNGLDEVVVTMCYPEILQIGQVGHCQFDEVDSPDVGTEGALHGTFPAEPLDIILLYMRWQMTAILEMLYQRC